jgi:surface protein
MPFKTLVSSFDILSSCDVLSIFCMALLHADITGWNTASVTDARSMFWGASAWVVKYKRTDGNSNERSGGGTYGPPSDWTIQ